MTYENFKEELYRNVQEMDMAQGQKVRLLERFMVCSDPVAARMLHIMNRSMYGQDMLYIKEDMLCALWSENGRQNVQHWLIRPLYERYRQEGWQSILPEIAMALGGIEKEEDLLTGELPGYAVCRRHMILRPVNYERYRQELSGGVYRRIGDIALSVQLLTSEREGNMTIPLQRAGTMAWQMTSEQLITEAMMNTCRKMPPRLFHAGERRSFFPEGEGILLPEEEGVRTRIDPADETEAREGYLITTTHRINGAIAFFYPGVRAILASRMDGDYYVVFPSVHEAIIHPVGVIRAQEIKASLQHINAVYGEGEMLSGRIFCYHRNRRLLQML